MIDFYALDLFIPFSPFSLFTLLNLVGPFSPFGAFRLVTPFSPLSPFISFSPLPLRVGELKRVKGLEKLKGIKGFQA